MTRDPVSGTWYVVRTSLPLWRRRTDPSITYAPLPDGRVVDTVRYLSRGKPRLVVGVDASDGDEWDVARHHAADQADVQSLAARRGAGRLGADALREDAVHPGGLGRLLPYVGGVPASTDEAVHKALARHDVPDLFAPRHTEGAR